MIIFQAGFFVPSSECEKYINIYQLLNLRAPVAPGSPAGVIDQISQLLSTEG
jgi:hypothetical protein